MAKQKKVKKFKEGAEKGKILCRKHEVPIVRKSLGYGFYCPECQAERQAEPAKSLLYY